MKDKLLPTIADVVNALPELPGVYRYYDKEGSLLYIGKAKNLKKRVASYFNRDIQQSAKTKLLVKKIADIQHNVVNTERDALLLENALIKQYQPKYNIALKDDKSYPFIKITNEHFPKVFFTRQYIKDGAEYFGPYTSLHYVRELMDLIKQLYPIRSCDLNLSPKNIQAKKYRVCLEFHIGNCLGPCEGRQTEEDYLKNIEEIRTILRGKLSVIRQVLKERMEESSKLLQFEEAERWKNKMIFLNDYMARNHIVHPGLGNFHVFGYHDDEKKAYINYLYVYDGTIVKAKNIILVRKLDEPKEYILEQAIIDTIIHIENKEPLILPFELDEENGLKDFSSSIPKIGDKKKLLDLAHKNAMFIKNNEIKKNTNISNEERILQIMKEDFRMKVLPYHIECFDNSNIQGAFPVAAVTVFKNTKPSRADYRHFNIKTVEGPNDFDSMKEIVYRRYKRIIEEKGDLPQLIVIDGGKGQLSKAMDALTELGIEQKIRVISIAKRLEEIYFPGDSYPLHISKKSETLKVIQHIRDEVHRFAISFHRDQRSRGTIKTNLTDIPGIGPKTAELLLKKIGSVKKIKTTSPEAIEKLIGKAKTQVLINFFKE
ncbi:MAG: excinuclease ABC subunit UvrC [Chitinophagales bacterium]|nr:excinuclease ABC subunit UvrC [Chitinophagales bacterium]MCZ2394175.1 excinuclease ABC subunit UvrC [Chitinophagales bacterium]